MKKAAPIVGRLMTIGLFMGLVYGLVEGLLAVGLAQIPGGLSWKNGTAPPILLIAPLFYGIVYTVIALVVALPAALLPRPYWDVALVWGLGVLSALMAALLQGELFSTVAAAILAVGVGTAIARGYLPRRESWTRGMRRALPAVVAIALAVGVGGGYLLPALLEHLSAARQGAVRGNGRNVLLLVLDTQRADHLSAYGYARATTPHLDSLAHAGALYELAFAGAPTTLPSHATMMTGLPVHQHLAGSPQRGYLDHRYPTIAEVMRDHGYRTGGFVANIFFTGRASGINRGFQHYEDYFGHMGDALTRTVLGRRIAYRVLPRFGLVDIPGRKHAADVNREFLHWLGAGKQRPFFAFLNYMDVHAPYLPPAGYAGRFGEAATDGKRPDKIEIGAWDENAALPDSATLAQWRTRYDESLAYLDAQIGLLLDSLRTRGVLQNTVVILTADHGEGFGEHGMVHHGGGLYPEQIRVPLIVYREGAPWSGKRVTAPVGLGGIPAAVAAWTGIKDAPFPRGGDIRSMLTDSTGGPVLSEGPYLAANPHNWQTGQGWVWSLVMPDGRQFIQLQSSATELYDLRSDPHARDDLDQNPDMLGVMRALSRQLNRMAPVTLKPQTAGRPPA